MEKQSISRNIRTHWYFPHVLFEYAIGVFLGRELKRVQTRALALLEDFCFIRPLFSSFLFHPHNRSEIKRNNILAMET